MDGQEKYCHDIQTDVYTVHAPLKPLFHASLQPSQGDGQLGRLCVVLMQEQHIFII